MLRIPIVDQDGIPAWPELFPISRIDDMRNTVGPRHFSAQMMLEFTPPDRARLDPDSLHLYDDEFDARYARIGDNKITGLVAYWDPSSGRRGHDASVCALIYRDDTTRRIFIHDILYLVVPDEELHPMARQCEMVLDFMSTYDIRRVSIETNGIGNALPEIMRDVAIRRGAGISVLRVTNSARKETRILDAIEPVLNTGRLYAHRRITQTPFIAEMLGWSPIARGASHDDGLDAVSGAIGAVPTPVRPIGVTAQSFRANTNFKI